MIRTMLITLSLGWCTFVALGQSGSSEKSNEAKATVCQVLADPLRYDGRVLRISGRFAGTDEGSWMVGDNCPKAFVTEGHVWPNEIALADPGVSPRLRIHTPDFEFDTESGRKASDEYKRLLKLVPERCILVTITGLFETRTNWSEAKAKYADGTWKFLGFGHQNESPAQILVKSQDEVTVVPGCPKNANRK